MGQLISTNGRTISICDDSERIGAPQKSAPTGLTLRSTLTSHYDEYEKLQLHKSGRL